MSAQKAMPPRKEAEPEDPMELRGVALPGDTLEPMAECLVEEYLRMGYQDLEVFYLFKDPRFAATHRVYREKGPEYVKGLIARVRGERRGGVSHV